VPAPRAAETASRVSDARRPATRRAPDFVQVRGEASAEPAACAHAEPARRPGCCLTPHGAGALRLPGGLFDAALDRQPVARRVAAAVGGLTPSA
jgi:thiamine pyrophosphate-dependent acetolactate synthase large subunit-like protein